MSTQMTRLYRSEEHKTFLLTNYWIPKDDYNGVCKQTSLPQCALYTARVKVSMLFLSDKI